MVLRRDLDQAKVEVLDRVVGPVMAEPQAARLGTSRARHDLVSEADPEQRSPVLDDGAGQRDLGLESGRVAGARRQDDAIDARAEDVRRRRRVRKDADARSAMLHRLDDVGLEAEVDDPDQRAARIGRAIVGDRRRRHEPDEVLVLPTRNVPGHGLDGRDVRLLPRRGDHSPLAPVRAQMPGERAGVDAGDRRDPVVAQEGRQLARILKDCGRGIRNHEPAQPRLE